MNQNKARKNRRFLSACLSTVLMATLVIPILPAAQVSAAQEQVTEAIQQPKIATTGHTYYLSNDGNDMNDGMSEEQAWTSLDKVNSLKFQPGDHILFKAGDVWNGSMKLRETSGTKEAPIVFSSYGDIEQDGRPVINGNGTTTTEKSAIIQNYNGVADKTLSATIDVVDGSYLEFSNFEITNFNPDVISQRAGINIRTASTTIAEWEANPHQGIVITNNYIHDVDGNPKGWKVGSGGILILGNISDVLVENNIVKRVDIEGIRNAGLYKEGDIKANFPRVFKNIIFNNNYVEEVQGDGFVMSNVGENGRMEYNTVVKHSAKNVGNVNYAGLWVIGVKDMIMQYNEVYGGIYGYNDGQAFDVDMFCEGTLYQYNYSHSNRGGFILFMGGSTNSLVRYNMSVNDGDGRYIFHYLPTTSADAPIIHNNTFFIDSQIKTKLISDSGKYLKMYNNIFYSKANTPVGQDKFAGGEMKNNIFYPGTGYQDGTFTGISLKDNIFASPQFARAGEEPQDLIDAANSTFDVEQLNGYKLLPGSPAIDAGQDMSAITPSVWSAATKDFFNNPITDGKVDIGAHEYSGDEPANQKPEIMPELITLSKSELELYAQQAGRTLTATFTPSNAWFQGVKWSSSNPQIATVNSNGFIMPMAPGEAIITAESTVDPSIKAHARVQVLAPSPIVSYQVATNDGELSEAHPSVQLRMDGITEEGKTMLYAPFYHVRYSTNQEQIVVDPQTGVMTATGTVTGVDEVEVTAEVQEYKDLRYTQSFEAGWGDFIPESGSEIKTATISNKVAYHGEQSALYVTGDGNNAIQKLFGSPQQGVVSMMMYDDGTKETKTRVVAHVGNARSTLLAGMGILNDGSTSYGSLDYYSVRASGSSTAWETTTVKRSKGWHELKWDYTSGTDLKMYIDGTLVKTTTAIKSFDRIVLGFLWDSANGRTFAFDNIKYALSDEVITKSAVPLRIPVKFAANKEALGNAISVAQSVYDAAVVGHEPGQYPEGSKESLRAAIGAAQEVYDKDNASQGDVSAAIATLNLAVETFKSSVIVDPSEPVDKAALIEAISVARAVYENAEEGMNPGQYPTEAKIRFGAAIETAEEVAANEEATQYEIQTAINTLNTALEAFRASMVPVANSPTWMNSRLTASGVTTSGMRLTWSGEVNASEVTGYKIYKDGTELVTVTGSVYQYDITGLSSNTTYTFKVEASNEHGLWSMDGPNVVQRTQTQETSNPNPSTPNPTTPEVSKPDDQNNKDKDKGKETEGESTGTDEDIKKPEILVTDIEGHWAVKLIKQALTYGFVQGYEDNTFRPDAKVTRAEFATMLGRALRLEQQGELSFADVDKIPAWARSFISAAVGAGIIHGYEDHTFRPAKELTRVELAVMVVRTMGLPVDPQAKLSFSDAGQIPVWAMPYVVAAYEAKLIQGRGDGTFAPNDAATRAESISLILAILMR